MSDDVRTGGGEPAVKVVDRRRFRADGGPIEPEQEQAQAERPEEGTAPSAPAPGEREAELEAKLAQQASRIDELTRAYATLVEDNKAFRSRMEREKQRLLEVEQTRVAQALLDTADELERGLAAVTGASAEDEGVLATLAEGVRITLTGLTKRIGEMGAQRLQVVGQRFDPRVAEAIDAVPVADESQDEMVLQEVRPGYRIGDRILRPARVRVGRLARA